MSEPAGAHAVTVTTSFGVNDPPDAVCTLLEQLASEIPLVVDGRAVTAAPTGPGTYAVTLPIGTPAVADQATALFRRRLWYSSRRAGLHLDGASLDGYAPPEQVEQAMTGVAATLHLQPDEVQPLVASVRLEQFGDGETVAHAGRVPDRVSFVVDGRVDLFVAFDGGSQLRFAQLGRGDAVGLTALTREPNVATAVAVGPVTVLQVPGEVIDTLVQNRPRLARDLGAAIDLRRQAAIRAKADAERPLQLPTG
jgi:CRP-like cAMP-binding protein